MLICRLEVLLERAMEHIDQLEQRHRVDPFGLEVMFPTTAAARTVGGQEWASGARMATSPRSAHTNASPISFPTTSASIRGEGLASVRRQTRLSFGVHPAQHPHEHHRRQQRADALWPDDGGADHHCGDYGDNESTGAAVAEENPLNLTFNLRQWSPTSFPSPTQSPSPSPSSSPFSASPSSRVGVATTPLRHPTLERSRGPPRRAPTRTKRAPWRGSGSASASSTGRGGATSGTAVNSANQHTRDRRELHAVATPKSNTAPMTRPSAAARVNGGSGGGDNCVAQMNTPTVQYEGGRSDGQLVPGWSIHALERAEQRDVPLLTVSVWCARDAHAVCCAVPYGVLPCFANGCAVLCFAVL